MTNASQSCYTLRLVAWVWRYFLPILLLILAVRLMLPQLTTFEQALQIIKGMKLWAMMLAVAAPVVSYLGSGYLLQAIVAVVGQRLSLIRGVLITTASSSIGLVAGGLIVSVAATYRWARGSGVSTEGAILAGWLPTLFNNGVLVIASIAGLLHLLITHELSTLQAISFGLILLLLGLIIGGAIWSVQHRTQLANFAVWIATRWAKLRHQLHDPDTIKATIGRLFSAWDALRAGGWLGPALGAALRSVSQ